MKPEAPRLSPEVTLGSSLKPSGHPPAYLSFDFQLLITFAIINAARYLSRMIISFKSVETEGIFHRERARKLPQDIQHTALRKLLLIDGAADLNDLRVPPGNHLEVLTKDRAGQYRIGINDRLRICFWWKDGNAFGVEIIDYH